jgi:hypothetical protein
MARGSGMSPTRRRSQKRPKELTDIEQAAQRSSHAEQFRRWLATDDGPEPECYSLTVGRTA